MPSSLLYKYRSGRNVFDKDNKQIFYRDIETLAENKIWIPYPGELNDPAEGMVNDDSFQDLLKFFDQVFNVHESAEMVRERYGEFIDHLKSCGVYSLSREICNELMWAYYANGHNGYAIIFDSDAFIKSYEEAPIDSVFRFDVRYVDKVPVVDPLKFHEPVNKTLELFIGRKSKAWKHEKETRFIFNQGHRLLEIDYRIIKGIVFGYKMPEEDRRYIMEKMAGRNLSYYEMKLNRNTYQFHKEKVEDPFKDAPQYKTIQISYDLDAILEADYGERGIYHRKEVEYCLDYVSREPFVQEITHIVCTDETELNIKVFTSYNKPEVFRRVKDFEFVLDKKGNLQLKK